MKAVTMGAGALVTACAAVLATAGGTGAQADARAEARTGDGADENLVRVRGSFGPPRPGARAVTYDQELVPEGAVIRVVQYERDGRTAVAVGVRGVAPDRTFGTHVHTAPCGAQPADAGGHYQHEPGEGPAYVTPDNEVWLDFTSGATGAGGAFSRQGWTFREDAAASVVLHALPTATGDGERPAGDAGPRAACVTVPFEGTAPGRRGQDMRGAREQGTQRN